MRNLEAEAKKVVATKHITAVKEKSKISHCDIRKDTCRASLKLARPHPLQIQKCTGLVSSYALELTQPCRYPETFVAMIQMGSDARSGKTLVSMGVLAFQTYIVQNF